MYGSVPRHTQHTAHGTQHTIPSLLPDHIPININLHTRPICLFTCPPFFGSSVLVDDRQTGRHPCRIYPRDQPSGISFPGQLPNRQGTVVLIVLFCYCLLLPTAQSNRRVCCFRLTRRIVASLLICHKALPVLHSAYAGTWHRRLNTPSRAARDDDPEVTSIWTRNQELLPRTVQASG